MYFGEVAFPPEVFLVLWSQSRHSIVRVHDDMHEGVDHGTKESCKGEEDHVQDDAHEQVVKMLKTAAREKKKKRT